MTMSPLQQASDSVSDAAPVPDPARVAALATLVEHLSLVQQDTHRFQGSSIDFIGTQAVFGGQVLGQALMAAARTVPVHRVHSLHAYFLRPGDKALPIDYVVDPVRDGKGFSMRQVVAMQNDKPIFHMSASFQQREPGVEHQSPMPVAPAPERLPDEFDQRRRLLPQLPSYARTVLQQAQPLDIRLVNPPHLLEPQPKEPQSQCWFRSAAVLPDDPLVHQALLAYASDFNFIRVAMQPHGMTFMQPDVQCVSLDHAMWFHHDFRFDDWLLYATDSPCASGARGLARGQVFTRQGKLVASVAQEGLIRQRS